MNLFDIINNISNSKKDDISEHEDFQKEYNPFMVNRFLSMDHSTLFFANEASKMSSLPKHMQYHFLFHGVDKKKRYFKYVKQDKSIENIDYVCMYYQINKEKAVEIIQLLSDNQIKQIKSIFDGSEKERIKK